MSLVVFAGNIAGATRIPRLLDALDGADAGVLTEAYHFGQVVPGYRLVRFSMKHGAEARDVSVLVRDGVQVKARRLKKMGVNWWGPFTRRKRAPRRYPVLVLIKDGKRWPLLAAHFPPGGPSGGIKTRGRNKGAWHESAIRCRRWLALRDRAVIVGDLNAKHSDVSKHVAPSNAEVHMISGVDGALAKGATIAARKLNAPAGMHGWGIYTFKETR